MAPAAEAQGAMALGCRQITIESSEILKVIERSEAAAWPLLFQLSVVHPIVMVQTRFHGRVAVLPVAAIGVRIARSQVLAICIWVELRAIPGIFDNGLRERGSCESCRGNSGGANQCEFHLGLHHRSSSSHDIFLLMARAISDHFSPRPHMVARLPIANGKFRKH
jgi:hypothetical protein